MAKRKKMWLASPPKSPKPKMLGTVKMEVEQRLNELVESLIKPKHIKFPPVDTRFNYLVDISTRWYRNYFYFNAKYHFPGANAIEPFFETGFARMEYVGVDTFNLLYMRHTARRLSFNFKKSSWIC